MAAYYNEWDKKTAAWLRELITAGLIADGEVDERSITEVQPADLAGFTQCHFFAGIGGWSYALRLAAWSDERAVWTGSCPCQPFSDAGYKRGFEDPRHLWPAWFRLIRQCRPRLIFGEQVASADSGPWFDLVADDMEREDYAIWPVDLPAPSVGAAGERQRLWFVADAPGARSRTASEEAGARDASRWRAKPGRESIGMARRVGDAHCAGLEERIIIPGIPGATMGAREREAARGAGAISAQRLADAYVANAEYWELQRSWRLVQPARDPLAGFWAGADWLLCDDGKARPVEPGTFPLAHGLPARVGRLRGYGNAIVPQVAAEVIGAYMDIVDG